MHDEPAGDCPEGEIIMRLIDATIRLCAPSLGVGRRWLKEQLAELGVKILLSEGCLQDLVDDADAATWQRLSASHERRGYLSCLREELAARAEFVRRWTCCDERIESDDERSSALVRIARNYALPRPWKLTEPVATARSARQPSYWKWPTRTAGMELAPHV
jgi:hypothetical protein